MQETKNNDFLGRDPLGGLLFKLALPTITAQLINMFYNVVDRVYIGHMADVGDLALTGVGVCMPLIMIISAFAALVSGGGAPRASIFMGQGDRELAEQTMTSCFSLQCIISVVLTALLLVFHRPILLTFGASENTVEYACRYMQIYSLGTIFVQLTLGMNAYITAQGFAKIGMLTVIIGALANIVLDPLFIFGFNMGVGGAALATVISQAISCIWVIAFLCGRKSILHLDLRKLRIESSLVLPCIALGSAHFIMQASESVISVCFNSSLLAYGGDVAVGAMTILTSVMQFAMLPLQGLAQGAQPIISYNYGAKKKERVKGIFRLLLCTSLIYSVAVWAMVMLFPRGFASIFTSDVTLLDFTERALRIYCAVLGIFGIQIACQMTFVSLGKAGSSMIVAIMRKFVLLLPLIYIVPGFFEESAKTFGVYLAEPIADVVAVSFTSILFAIMFKRALKSMDNEIVK